MSTHKSLRSKARLIRRRNVLTRMERVRLLEEQEKWKEGQSVFGLPKIKIKHSKIGKKAKKEEKAAAVPGAEGAAPAGAEAAAAAPAGEAARGKASEAAKGKPADTAKAKGAKPDK